MKRKDFLRSLIGGAAVATAVVKADAKPKVGKAQEIPTLNPATADCRSDKIRAVIDSLGIDSEISSCGFDNDVVSEHGRWAVTGRTWDLAGFEGDSVNKLLKPMVMKDRLSVSLIKGDRTLASFDGMIESIEDPHGEECYTVRLWQTGRFTENSLAR